MHDSKAGEYARFLNKATDVEAGKAAMVVISGCLSVCFRIMGRLLFSTPSAALQ